MSLRIRLILIGAVALGLVLAGATWLYKGYQKKQQERAIVAALGDTTAKLRTALAAPSGEAAAAIDAHLGRVKAAGYSPLADAAEHYILGAREIARRRVDGARLAREAAAGRQALTAHMHSGARRGPGWFRGAMDLKKKVEHDHRELDRSLKSLEELLTSLPDSAKLLEPHVGAGVLLEDSVRQNARARAQDDARRAAAELQKVRNLTP